MSSGYISKKLVCGLNNQKVPCGVEQSCHFDTEALQMCEYQNQNTLLIPGGILFLLQGLFAKEEIEIQREWKQEIKI